MQLKAQHPTRPGKQPLRPLVLRMAFQPWVVHPRHLRLLSQKARESQPIFVVLPHSQRQGLQAPLQQEAGVDIQRAAQVIQLVLNGLDVCSRADDHARDDIRMAVEVLGRAV